MECVACFMGWLLSWFSGRLSVFFLFRGSLSGPAPQCVLPTTPRSDNDDWGIPEMTKANVLTVCKDGNRSPFPVRLVPRVPGAVGDSGS